MGKHNQYAPPFPSGHRTPFTDLTNSPTVGNAQITDEKESASPHRRHVNHQHNIPSAGDSVTHEPVAHTHASSIGAVQCTAFSDITNTPTDGCTSTSSATHLLDEVNGAQKKEVATVGATSTPPPSMRSSLPDEQDVVIQKQRRGQSWYARLSDERRAEYLNKQRMAQRDKKAARTVALPQSSSPQGAAETSLPDNDAITQHQLPEIVGDCNIRTGKGWYASLSGQRKEEHLRKLRISHKQKRAGLLDVDVNEEKERNRKKIRYLEMTMQQKDALLEKNRAYKRGKRKRNHTDVRSGSSYPSPHTPATGLQPSHINSHTGGRDDEDDYDAHGIFEPMGPVAEMMECLHTVRTGDTLSDDDDEECRLFSVQGNEFESYRVTDDGSHALDAHDPYDYVYKNLPSKHHVLKPVKDCVHCGAMRFEYDGPAFCCRKGKVKIFIPEVPQDQRRLFTSQRTHYLTRLGRQDGTVSCHMRDQLPLRQAMRMKATTRTMNEKQGVVDTIASGETRAAQIGKRIMLPL
ncbi:hypothetical protein TRIUR3_20164 [Triticum urartu]|uniref:Uncharacterized protein n=2 Tax=Triticum urartu TaxID=4572 RepID=M7ZAN9_TRIUA|nr:hypothetical protein TRIUR3_20164 [Triticum urartu]